MQDVLDVTEDTKMMIIEPLLVRAYNLGVGKRQNPKHPKQREKVLSRNCKVGDLGSKKGNCV